MKEARISRLYVYVISQGDDSSAYFMVGMKALQPLKFHSLKTLFTLLVTGELIVV